MNQRIALPFLLLMTVVGGCAEMGGQGGTKYGETNRPVTYQSERDGTIAQLDNIEVDNKYKLGVGTAVGGCWRPSWRGGGRQHHGHGGRCGIGWCGRHLCREQNRQKRCAAGHRQHGNGGPRNNCAAEGWPPAGRHACAR